MEFTVKELSEVVTCAMLRDAFPSLVITTCCEALLPTLTSPKSRDEGLIARAPFVWLVENAAELDPQLDRPSTAPTLRTAIPNFEKVRRRVLLD
jgi:hypothetical protein